MSSATKKYSEKRRPEKTPEPSWSVKKDRKGPLIFVVQRHDSRRLHFDFRLELDGVLKSWAVPKGISLNPKVKRLAVMVEDHPLDYGSFEGTIPEGEYGAGEVTIWDNGTYFPVREDKKNASETSDPQEIARKGLEKGKLSFNLNGEKLKGSFALVRMKKRDKNWLLIKHQDEYASEDPDAISEVTERVRPGSASVPEMQQPSEQTDLKKIPGARLAPFLESLNPMLAFATDKAFSDPGWIFEPKLDGFRTLAFIKDGDVRLLSRSGLDATGKYPEVVGDLRRRRIQAVLDGEMVGLDEKGHPCFQCLQNQEYGAPIIYYVFDIIYAQGYDLSSVRLMDRKKVLSRLLRSSEKVRLLDFFEEDGELVFDAAVRAGFEGIMAKRRDSLYEPGRRTRNWLKIKSVSTEDFVIGGYAPGRGMRSGVFGALLLGYPNKEGALIYAGQVGTGFSESQLTALKKRLDALKILSSPFVKAPHFHEPITWVRPEIVVEVKFAQITRDGLLRAPVFLRLRDDKPASQVIEPITITLDIQPASPMKPKTTRPSDSGDSKGDLPLTRGSGGVPQFLSSPRTGGFRGFTSVAKHPQATVIADIVSQLSQNTDKVDLELEGSRVLLDKLDKIYWPEFEGQRAVTKRDLLVYLTRASAYILPHLRDRPITLSRFPGGITGEHFWQRHYHSKLPEFVETVTTSDEKQPYILCDNLSTLLWLGQLGNLEIHSWFSRIRRNGGKIETDALDYPDFIIFDLDPYVYSGEEPAGAEPELNAGGFKKTIQTAKWLREVLDGLSLPSFIKTSGKTGLHVYVPIEQKLSYDATRSAARTVATHLLKKHAGDVTTQWAVAKRKGKVFVDFNQNVRSKTLASVYSPRPAPGAAVSMAISWDELNSVYPTDFTVLNAAERLMKKGDPWSDILLKKVDVEALIGVKSGS